MQTNINLMDEMKKIKRVSKPDLVIFVGDALTGNDATQQAAKFNEAINIDGVILTKADADSKGDGASLSIGYVIKKPILFLGMGQGYDDIMEYNAEWMLNQLFSDNSDDGVAHGLKPRDYHQKVNKKVRRLAMLSALSVKVRDSLMTEDVMFEKKKERWGSLQQSAY